MNVSDIFNGSTVTGVMGVPEGAAGSLPIAGEGSRGFQKLLNQATTQPSTQPGPSIITPEQQKQAHDAAAGLVSNALILPVLKQLRHSPWRENAFFSGGTAEKAFGPQFDMQIADRIAQSPRMSATTVLTQRLLSRGQRIQRLPATSGNTGKLNKGLDVNG